MGDELTNFLEAVDAAALELISKGHSIAIAYYVTLRGLARECGYSLTSESTLRAVAPRGRNALPEEMERFRSEGFE